MARARPETRGLTASRCDGLGSSSSSRSLPHGSCLRLTMPRWWEISPDTERGSSSERVSAWNSNRLTPSTPALTPALSAHSSTWLGVGLGVG
eukprot:scaffold50200_cov45-Phaeocystis_antarctica.AAC.1